MDIRWNAALARVTGLTGLLFLATSASAEIGSVGAVNEEMRGTPPVSEPMLLVIGDALVQDELVESTETGSGQLLFLDQTTLSLGPNSEVVLDRYVYDPDRGTGEVTLTMAKGVMRFIGGKISKTGDAEIHTPMASIGVRGGMALTEVYADGVTKVTNLASSYIIVSQNCDDDEDGFDDGDLCAGEPKSLVTLSRPGSTATAGADGVKYSGLVSAEDLASLYSALEGGSTGGLPQPPTIVRFIDGSRQVAPINSQIIGGPYVAPVTTTGESLADVAFGPLAPGDPSGFNQAFGSAAQQIGGITGGLNKADAAVIAALTGTASYAGTLTATQTFFGATPVSEPTGGTFNMAYDFTDREGTISFDVAFSVVPNGDPINSIFTVDVFADPNNAADYAGSDPIFGTGSTSAQGSFFTGPDDPNAIAQGDFQISIPPLDSEVTGTFEGPLGE